MMKVTAHIVVAKGSRLALAASQWPAQLIEQCEERNRELHESDGASDYLAHDRDSTVVTVEFEVPDEVFKRTSLLVLQGSVTTV